MDNVEDDAIEGVFVIVFWSISKLLLIVIGIDVAPIIAPIVGVEPSIDTLSSVIELVTVLA